MAWSWVPILGHALAFGQVCRRVMHFYHCLHCAIWNAQSAMHVRTLSLRTPYCFTPPISLSLTPHIPVYHTYCPIIMPWSAHYAVLMDSSHTGPNHDSTAALSSPGHHQPQPEPEPEHSERSGGGAVGGAAYLPPERPSFLQGYLQGKKGAIIWSFCTRCVDKSVWGISRDCYR